MPTLPTFIDIDGTLTEDPENAFGLPRYGRIEIVRQMIHSGEEVVLWSARGRSYVYTFAQKHGLQRALCISKPSRIVDDNPTIRPMLAVETPEAFFRT